MENALEYILILAGVVLMFGLSILVHEFGHFIVARKAGLKVEAFAIGFGPKIVSWVRNGIEYSLRWIPAGGFVRLPQLMNAEALEGETQTKEPLPPVPLFPKLAVLVAGPLMNLVFAFAVATILYFVGLPMEKTPPVIGGVEPGSEEEKIGLQPGDRIVSISGIKIQSWEQMARLVMLAPSNRFDVVIQRDGFRTNVTLTAHRSKVFGGKWLNILPQIHPVVGYVEPGMPAAKAGLKEGDRIVRFNGVPVVSRTQLIELVAKSEGKESTIIVDRNGQLLTFKITPIYDPKTKRGRIGVMLPSTVYYVVKPGPAPWKQVWHAFAQTVQVIQALFHSKETGVRPSDLSGPVGIIGVLAVRIKTDLRLALDFLVLLNVNLFILNLLPIPVLDGGHILLSLLSGLWWLFFGTELPQRLVELTTTAFAIALISFMLYVTFHDVVRIPYIMDLFKVGSPVRSAPTETQTTNTASPWNPTNTTRPSTP